MKNPLKGYKVAMLVATGFEEVELIEPRKALEEEGAEVLIVSPEKNSVKSWNHTDWGSEFSVDVSLEDVNSKDYHALVLPGGVINPDKLRINDKAVKFVKEFFDANKPVAAICHGPWILINAEAAKGRKLTSWPSLKMDLMNAGAQWVDEKVVRDGKLVTSRKPEDLKDFNQEIIKVFSEEISQ